LSYCQTCEKIVIYNRLDSGFTQKNIYKYFNKYKFWFTNDISVHCTYSSV
jgi:hypothetical protein